MLYFVDETQTKIVNYHFFDSLENKYLEFALEDDEEKLVSAFCHEHYQEAGE